MKKTSILAIVLFLAGCVGTSSPSHFYQLQNLVFLHLLESRLTDAATLGLRHQRHGSHHHGSQK